MANVFAGKSNQNWLIAKKLHQERFIDAATNRYYYSVFQSVKGYAVGVGEMNESDSDRVHSAILVVVKGHSKAGAGVFFRRVVNELAGLRVKADYYSISVDESELAPLLADAEKVRNFFLEK